MCLFYSFTLFWSLCLYVMIDEGCTSIIPTTEIAVTSRDLVRLPLNNELPKDLVVIRDTNKFDMVIAVITTSAALVAAGCGAASLIGGLPGAASCIALVVLALFASYLAAFLIDSPPPADTSSSRSLPSEAIDWAKQYHGHDAYQPTEDCNTICQFKSNVGPNVWAQIGNITVGQVFHEIHLHHSGNLTTMRAVQRSSGIG
jgi:hypothetical protein